MASLKISSFTLLALCAFAGNSILCRLVLGEHLLDAAGFTVIRLLSGIVTLLLIIKVFNGRQATEEAAAKGSWLASFWLFLYALTFSFGYLSLDTGTGALVLFGAVQITMIMLSVFSGKKLHYSEWLGIGIAFSGVIYLMLPSLTLPSLSGFMLMIVAGISWAFYTIKGKTTKSPVNDTAYNFLRTLPFIFILILFTYQDFNLTWQGVLLAIISGAVTSGIGYAIWYITLKELTVTQAAVLQLLVPILAAIGGVIFINEILSLRLIMSSLMVLGGIFIVVLGKRFLKDSDLNKS
ncbi:MAG: drug/metabolite transporter (DMT)-like permease [Alteromonadaceae bacterium]|jgi:drug/metabolite transporter (DMT)-like permease